MSYKNTKESIDAHCQAASAFRRSPSLQGLMHSRQTSRMVFLNLRRHIATFGLSPISKEWIEMFHQAFVESHIGTNKLLKDPVWLDKDKKKITNDLESMGFRSKKLQVLIDPNGGYDAVTMMDKDFAKQSIAELKKTRDPDICITLQAGSFLSPEMGPRVSYR